MSIQNMQRRIVILDSLVATSIFAILLLKKKILPSMPLSWRPGWTMSRALCRGGAHVRYLVWWSSCIRVASPMATQVGGHKPTDRTAGMLSLGTATVSGDVMSTTDKRRLADMVLKPVQSGERGVREISFYDAMTRCDAFWRGTPISSCKRESFAGLAPFLCGYHGVTTLDVSETSDKQRYIMLDDCTAHMMRPCVLDVKLGMRTTEPRSILEKQRKTLSKYPCQSEFGCRIVGMQVWAQRQHRHLLFDKGWGFSLRNINAISRALTDFFGGHPELINKRLLIADFARRLAALLDWFEGQNQLSFVSSSLLFVYEGANDGFNDIASKSELKIIDFAHVRSDNILDSGYIQGLQIVVRLFEDIRP